MEVDWLIEVDRLVEARTLIASTSATELLEMCLAGVDIVPLLRAQVSVLETMKGQESQDLDGKKSSLQPSWKSYSCGVWMIDQTTIRTEGNSL